MKYVKRVWCWIRGHRRHWGRVGNGTMYWRCLRCGIEFFGKGLTKDGKAHFLSGDPH